MSKEIIYLDKGLLFLLLLTKSQSASKGVEGMQNTVRSFRTTYISLMFVEISPKVKTSLFLSWPE